MLIIAALHVVLQHLAGRLQTQAGALGLFPGEHGRADRPVHRRPIGGANAYPAEISLPQDMERDRLRLGMPGTATVFADKAGVIGLLMSILVWISSYTAYL